LKLKTESLAIQVRKGATCEEAAAFLGPSLLESLSNEGIIQKSLQQIAAWQRSGIGMLTIFEQQYPESLKEIYDPPLILFFRGSLECLGANFRISIVGARKADTLGLQIAAKFSQALSERGALVISGLALGIDSAAHRGALDAGAKTIAVLGNGLQQIYPRTNEGLAREITESGGLILSQFEPPEAAYPSNFLNRNRIIAALSQCVLVIQASARSGSLVTARYGLEQGRDVLCVPGSITDPRYEGSNRLIQQGAYLVTSPDDFQSILPGLWSKVSESEPSPAPQLSQAQKAILELLRQNPSLHFDELRSCLKSQSFSEDLLELEYAGQIVRLPGNILALNARF